MHHPRKTAALCALLITALLHAQEPVRMSVHFQSASAELDATSGSALEKLCADIGDRIPTGVLITGHTDDRGPDRYNAGLSKRRADAVRAALRAVCPDLAGADIAWKGEQLPVADNGTEVGRAQNRRVDVTLAFEEETPPEAVLSALPPAFPVIKPLLPLVDKQREHFVVQASRSIDIRTKEGWNIHIDGGSIVDAQGNAVTGPVDVTCRAFFTPAEAIASGIPMFVGHGDDAGHMESAGMYEVLAIRSGEPLSLAPGRDITIQRNTAGMPGPGYNNFMLDPTTGQWRDEGPSTVPSWTTAVFPKTTTTNVVEVKGTGTDSLAAWWAYEQEMRRVPRMPDTLTFKARQMDRNYCLTTPCKALPDEKGMWKGRVLELGRTEKVPQIRLRTGSKRLASRGRVHFQLKFAKGWLHPEWGVFGEEKNWVYSGPMDRAKWLDSVASKHLYQDIELVAEPGSDQGTLRLKSQGDWIELPLDLSTYRHTKADELAWDRQLSTFHNRVANKIKQFDNYLASSTAQVKRRIQRDETSAYMMARRKMRDDEKAMAKADWIENARTVARKRTAANMAIRGNWPDFASWNNETIAAYEAKMYNGIDSDSLDGARARAGTIAQTLTMSGFGIYNCDRVFRQLVEPSAIAVVDEKGEPFRWHTAYGVLADRNAVITYWGNGSGKNDRMRLGKDMVSVMFIGPDNSILIAASPGKQCSGKASATVKGVRAAQPTTKEQLEALVSR